MKCPRRDSMTGEMGPCDPECGLLVDDACSNDNPRQVCAYTAIAESLSELCGMLFMGEHANAPTLWSAVNARWED